MLKRAFGYWKGLLHRGYTDAVKEYPDAFIFQLKNDEQNAGNFNKIDSNQHHSNKVWEKQVPMNQETRL